MNRFVVAALMSACAVNVSYAEVETVFSKDVWHLSMGTVEDDDAVCIAETGGNYQGRYFNLSFKVFGSYPDILQIWVMQEGWSIPEDVSTKILLEFDKMSPWDLRMSPYEDGGDTLWSYLQDKTSQQLFFEEFITANEVTLTFEGTERPWVLSMDGSAAVYMKFAECVDLLKRAPQTQPFDEKSKIPSQPFAEPAPTTQPFNT